MADIANRSVDPIPFAYWQVETEVFPTTATTNILPFLVSTLGRQDLFLRAQDWTGVTEHGNTTPDWWFWAYFGTTALFDTNLDISGNTLLFDYRYGFDPNVIQFSLQFTNVYVDASPVSYGETFIVRDDRDLLCCGANAYNARLHRQWTNGLGGTTMETWSDGIDPVETLNLAWPFYWPNGAALTGSISNAYFSSAYSAYGPTTWANATMEASGPVPLYDIYTPGSAQRQITRTAVTDVQLVAAGPATPGVFQLIRLLVSAAGYDDDGLVEWAGFYDTYPYNGFEEYGDLPLPATAVRVLGLTVATTPTNNDVGEKYVLIPSGAVHDLPVSATGTNSSNISFNIQPGPGLTIVDGNSGQDLTLQTNTVRARVCAGANIRHRGQLHIFNN